MINLIQGDCLSEMAKLKENSVDSIVTDSPYGINFMGKKWDYEIPSVEIWKQCLRVLKPGGYLLSFAGTRTQHRMACNIEDAGFEIRDMIGWIYGSGFPKSLNISKAIDKQLNAKREKILVPTKKGNLHEQAGEIALGGTGFTDISKPVSSEAQKWEGWGTALKPALEPITVARKPLSEKTVAENVLKYGTGGINIEGCRIEGKDKVTPKTRAYPRGKFGGTEGCGIEEMELTLVEHREGRWPANLIHDGSPEVEALFPETTIAGNTKDMNKNFDYNATSYKFSTNKMPKIQGDVGGSASRFFYCAKASKADRDTGLYKTRVKKTDESRKDGNPGGDNPRNRGVHERKNFHPTVKPTDLMQWLVRLITPKGGTVLDPFMGSGSTGRGAKLERFSFIGIEIDSDYFKMAEKRIASILAVQNEIDWPEENS